MKVSPDEPLAVLRCGDWKLGLPLAGVQRVTPAAMPVLLPQGAGSASHAIQVDGAMVPVIFGSTLHGRADVVMRPEDKLVLLGSDAPVLALWVDAVEDIVPFVPLPESKSQLGGLIGAISGGDPTLPVLDLDALLATVRA